METKYATSKAGENLALSFQKHQYNASFNNGLINQDEYKEQEMKYKCIEIEKYVSENNKLMHKYVMMLSDTNQIKEFHFSNHLL